MSNNVSFIVQSRTTQRNIAKLQQNMISRGNEVTTGKKQNLAKDLKGEVRNFVDLKSLRSSLLNRQGRLQTGDNRLAQMGIAAQEMSNLIEPFQKLQTQVSLINQDNIDVYVEQAKSALDGIQNTLNVQWGGRYLFSGDAVQTRPIEGITQLTTSVEDMITDYAASLPTGSITDEAELETLFAEIDTMFDDTHPTTTFSDLVYKGGQNDMAGIEISSREFMQYGTRADNSEFKNAIKGVVMMTANDTLRNSISNDNPNGSQVNKLEKAYLSKATEYSSGGISDLIQVQASIGFKQERISFRQDGLDKTVFEYEQRIGNYENADQYEASVAYNEIQTQLEASFYVTANLADLSLLNYIR
jgi:flagellin-like hook-associated protein FlgL